jgi:hypothetical protein
VNDEEFTRTRAFLVQLVQPVCVIEPMEEAGGSCVAEGAVLLSEVLGDTSPHVDLDDFKGVRDQVAELPIELVRLSNLVKGDVRMEDMARLLRTRGSSH